MKLQNIENVEKFFKVINSCKGPVELISEEGDKINLKSKLSQCMAIAGMFSHAYIRELDLVATEPEDIDRLIKFMYQGE